MKRVIKDDLIEAGILVLILFLIFIGSNLLYEVASAKVYTGLGFTHGYVTVSGKPVGHHVLIYILAMILGFLFLSYALHRLLWDERKK